MPRSTQLSVIKSETASFVIVLSVAWAGLIGSGQATQAHQSPTQEPATVLLVRLGIDAEALAASGAEPPAVGALLATIPRCQEEIQEWRQLESQLSEKEHAVADLHRKTEVEGVSQELLMQSAAARSERDSLVFSEAAARAEAVTQLTASLANTLPIGGRDLLRSAAMNARRHVVPEYRVLTLNEAQWVMLEAICTKATSADPEYSPDEAQLLTWINGQPDVIRARENRAQRISALNGAFAAALAYEHQSNPP